MFKLTLSYTAAVVVFLSWFALAHIAMLCDNTLKADWTAGERFDHVDDALEHLESLHTQLFGQD
jgi:hypothetical protein